MSRQEAKRSQLPYLQNNYPNHTNPHISSHNQHSPYVGPPPQAHFDPRNESNYFGFQAPAGTVGPYTAGYSSPTPLPGAYYGPPPGPQQQEMFYGPPRPQQQGMLYGPPPQPQQVLLGFQDLGSAQRAIYGPRGATIDWLGNVYFDHGDGVKEYIGPYRDAFGNIRDPPGTEKDDCVFC
ncbi:hypothetical protein MMC24_001838 [Lignoscripta atroalba]|nr:hypothetical protein [Lignoscripta atroalba]